jgi:phosphatidate cytidylyltransferase
MLRIRILTASILGAALLVSLFLLPPHWTVWVFAAVLSLAAWEWSGFGMLRSPAARLAYLAVVAGLLGCSWVWTEGSADHLQWLLAAACVWWVLAFAWLTFMPARHHPWVTLLCGVPVLVPAFIALARVQVSPRGYARGPEMVLWMLLLVFAADIGAYFAGRAFGRRKLAPRVSPGKTWEGALGGLAAVACVACFGAWHFGLPVVLAVAFGCALGIFSVIGDLTESMFKRSAGLKDSGSMLPGHGGVLDRIDSVTATAPLYALGLLGSGVIE